MLFDIGKTLLSRPGRNKPAIHFPVKSHTGVLAGADLSEFVVPGIKLAGIALHDFELHVLAAKFCRVCL